ncbi:MAG: 3-hydroxyacyl-CoA dehydrogenase family protein [Desulfomonilia bacterium]
MTLKKTLEVGDRLPCTNGSRMMVVLARWSPGFIINRSTAPVVAYLNWVVDQARKKEIKPRQLDATGEPFMRGFFRTIDFIGLDVVYETCLTLEIQEISYIQAD